MLSADPIISEMLASNVDGLIDFQGKDSDWIEIHNRGTSGVDLQGWYLTDDAALLTKWRFPSSAFLDPGDRIVVHASNQDLVDPHGVFHTNFNLGANGEFLALVDPGGLVVDSFSPAFPPQATNVSYGVEETERSVLNEATAASALVPADDSLGNSWTSGNEPFDDSGWIHGTTGAGYEAASPGAALNPQELATVLGGPSPLAYWTFDSPSSGGLVAADEQGNYHGNVQGATWTTGNGGRFGEALVFDGDDDFMSPGVIAELIGPSAFSVSLWFQRTLNRHGVGTSTNHNVHNVLIAHSSGSSNDAFEIGTDDGFAEVYLDTEEFGGPIPPIRTQASIQNDAWHQLVVTYDSQATVETKIYVDGALVHESSDYGGLVSDSGDSPLTIGLARPSSSRVGDFEGLIDDVAMWDVALEPEHVAALFPVPAPLAYWTFDALSAGGALALDEQGNYDGTVLGATATTGGQGRFGEALAFDGNDDSVSAGIIPELVNPAAFSASVWFNRTADHSGTAADTGHGVNNVLLAHSSASDNDTFEIGTENDMVEVYWDTEERGGPIPPIRAPAAIQNDRWHHLVVTYDRLEASELKIYLDGNLVNEYSEYGGLISASATSPFSIGLARPGGSSVGDFEGLIDDVAIWDAALDARQVAALFAGTSPQLATGSGYAPLIGIDLENQLHTQNSSTYARVLFSIDDPGAILSLNLDVRYDDAFVAYVNGTEVARSNFSGVPVWNSAADSDRPDAAAFGQERFVIANQVGLLNAGNNVLAVQGLGVAADSDRFLVLPELSVTGLPGELFSFTDRPTPGAANVPGFVGFAAPPTFSVPGGTFSDSLSVAITTPLVGSDIRYTTDRSVPTETSTRYTGPISIDTSTQIRTKVFHPSYAASEVVSETYVPLNSNVLDVSSDLPIVVLEYFGQGVPGGGRYPPTQDSLMLKDGYFVLFEPDSTGRSRLTNPADLTTRMGMHPRGASSFVHEKTNWRIEFRDERDHDRNLEILGLPADADWQLLGPYRHDRALVRNAFLYELSRQAGRWAPRTRFVEVYTNNNGDELSQRDYVGVYVLTERIEIHPDRVNLDEVNLADNEPPNVTGGYIIKRDRSGEPGDKLITDHGPATFGVNLVIHDPDPSVITDEQRNYLLDYLNDFEDALFGPNSKDPVVGYKPFVDIGSFIDEHMMRVLSHEPDTLRLSIYFRKQRNGPLGATPIWDFDRAMGNDRDVRSSNPVGFGGPGAVPAEAWNPFTEHWWGQLFTDPDFSQAWVDRWHQLRQSVFTDENVAAIIDPMASELAEAQQRNFNKWPAYRPNGGRFAERGLPPWEGEISHLKGWLSGRINWIDTQMLTPVTFSQQGGVVSPGFRATLAAPVGTIYYTLDGSDPRAAGGGVSPQAIEYTGGSILVDRTTRIVARTHSPTGGIFNLKRWSGTATADFVIPQGLVVSEIQFNPHDAVPARGELDTDNNNFEFIELSNTGDVPIDLGGSRLVQLDVDGDLQGIDFHFATQTLDPGEQIVVVKNRAAFQSRYGTGARIADGDDGLGGNNGEYGSRLSNAGERMTLLTASGVTLLSFAYEDRGTGSDRADGNGSSLELINLGGDPVDPLNWRPSTEYGGTPGASGIGMVTGVVVNEVLSNPETRNSDAIELYNLASDPVDIGGWWLSDKVNNLDRYVIPAGTMIPADGFLSLNEVDFGFGLNADEGETVALVQPDAAGRPRLFIDYVTFGPALPLESFGRWPDSAGHLYPMISTTFGATNSGPRIGPVVISEVMYNPLATSQVMDPQRLEFVELYNPTSATVDLTGWTVDGIGYTFPSNTSMGAGQNLIVVPFDPNSDATGIAAFESAYGVDIAANPSRYRGPYPGRLDNGGQRLTLRRAARDPVSGDPATFPLVIEDQVIYDNTAPWPTTADRSGISLQRQRVDLWGNDPESWLGGLPTPGRFELVKSVVLGGPTVIGEVGLVTNLTHQVRAINLSQTYNNPVVFAKPASIHGDDPVIVRVDDVQSTQFNLYLVEPSNLNGLHNTAESVSYLVLESGSHWLADGTYLEVGTITTSATVGKRVPSPTWQSVHFAHHFADVPAVLSQPQSAAGEAYLNTRQNLITSVGFDVALEQEEQITTRHDTETVGYVAIDQGTGIWNGMKFEAELTTAHFVGDHRFSVERFNQSFDAPPNFLASLATYEFNDNAHLRSRNLTSEAVQLTIGEDTTQDAEIAHGSEGVSYLAIGGNGPLSALSTPLADGQTRTFRIDINDAGQVSDVNVTLDLVHSRAEDLDMFLAAPDGTTVELLTDLGGEGDNLTSTTLDDEAELSITAATAPFMGTFKPEGRLIAFDGTDITGVWTLHVTDDTANGEGGALVHWSMAIELATEPVGNLNHDGNLDATDIDVLFANLGSSDPTFDLNGNGTTDRQDVRWLVEDLMGKRFGDVNLDQKVDILDANIVGANFDPLGIHPGTGWARGDFDGDGDVDIADFNQLVRNYAPAGYPAPANAQQRTDLILHPNVIDRVIRGS